MAKATHDSETLAEGQQVISAVAMITSQQQGETKVFLAKRADTKKFLPGVYEMPGGHIDFGEELVTGLKREVKEELGMDLSVGDCFAAFTYTNEIKKSHTIEVVYFAMFTSPLDEITIQPEDHSEYNWFSKADLHEAYTKNKGGDDVEFQIISKGFDILEGKAPERQGQ